MQVNFEGLYQEGHLNLLDEKEVNYIIKNNELNTNQISDGYHTFGELYEHRISLFITLCRLLCGLSTIYGMGGPIVTNRDYKVWRSKKHHDDSEFDGWFIMGIGTEKGDQVSYHLPVSKWDETNFCATLIKAPEWDGHTSNDVLDRLKKL